MDAPVSNEWSAAYLKLDSNERGIALSEVRARVVVVFGFEVERYFVFIVEGVAALEAVNVAVLPTHVTVG